MKLISLNIWGGRIYEPLIKYIKDNAGDTDIFCFQETFLSMDGSAESRGSRVDILNRLTYVLPDFGSFFAPEGSGADNAGPVNLEIEIGQAIFPKKSSVPRIDSEGVVFVGRDKEKKKLASHETVEDIPSNFQYLRFEAGGKNFTVCNIHGIAFPGNKLDTPERLKQSQIITDFLNGEKGAKILCGDFNLLPETESIKIIEGAGMFNLVKKFEIECTRSRLSPWFGRPGFQRFADYAFVSPEVNVLNFSVPDVAVSDHLPMVLEFS